MPIRGCRCSPKPQLRSHQWSWPWCAWLMVFHCCTVMSVLGLSISTSDIDGRCNCCEKQVLGSCQQKRSPSCKSHTGVTSPRRAMVAISSRLSLFVPPSGGTPRSYCSPEGRVKGIHRAPGRWNRRGCDTVGVRWLSTSTPLERSIIP